MTQSGYLYIVEFHKTTHRESIMSKKELFVELYRTSIPELSFGVMDVTKNTIQSAKNSLQQSSPVDEIHFASIKKSIIEEGFNAAYPVCLDYKTMRTLDGFTRISACIDIVNEGYSEIVRVPFYTAQKAPMAFNSASRGTSAEDLARFFKISRSGGLLTGSAKRAAEQSIEASQMLDVLKLGCSAKAFQAGKEQRHTSKIVREIESFIAAFEAVCDIATALDVNPDKLKWAHWAALFCRYGVNNTTKGIASNNMIQNTGTTQAARYKVFEKCAKEAFELGGL